MFDLIKIKEEIERLFQIEFKVEHSDLFGRDELVYRYKKSHLIIAISHYTCYDRLGQEFISVDWQSGMPDMHGRGSPCDSVEEVIHDMDYLGYKRREVPLERTEQLRLF